MLSRREFIDYKTSMTTDEYPLRVLLFYWDLGFSHTLHVLKETEVRYLGNNRPHQSAKSGGSFFFVYEEY